MDSQLGANPYRLYEAGSGMLPDPRPPDGYDSERRRIAVSSLEPALGPNKDRRCGWTAGDPLRTVQPVGDASGASSSSLRPTVPPARWTFWVRSVASLPLSTISSAEMSPFW